MQLLKQVHHQGIIRLFEIYENETYFILVYENIKGTGLNSFNKNRNKYSEADVAKMIKSLVSAIDCLHQLNIIHRDINPETLIFTEAEIKIIDLSMAIQLRGNQIETQCCGYRGYIAPEVLNKEGYGVKSDIFSCGLIIYFLY